MSYTEITPVVYPLQFVKGSDWKIEIPVVINDDDENMVFTGWTAKAQVRRNPNSDTVIATFSSYDLSLFLTEGKLTLDLPKEETTSVTSNTYWWDCVFTDSDGLERCLILPSEFKVIENVTEN